MTPDPDKTARHTPNRRGQGDRLRQDLITATNRLLEHGASHETLSLRAVAREVGIAATSVYLHFPDKMALLLAVYQEHFAVLARHLENAIAEHTDPADQLHAAAHAYCRFAADHPNAYQVMFTVPGSTGKPPRAITEDERPGLPAIQAVQRVISACADAGIAKITDPWLATLSLWGALHGVLSLRTARPILPWPPMDELIDAIVATHLTTPTGPAHRSPGQSAG
ncbi:TetR/AcrR family transcriptional regulator [Nonomuraea sp. NPDC049269]|uniref:TetR/AcrR family transcriptional regulator n=1 Tax=Nonomuraea sp. NPDC049269 TaxID=3364349 RepID=UPI0037100C1B